MPNTESDFQDSSVSSFSKRTNDDNTYHDSNNINVDDGLESEQITTTACDWFSADFDVNFDMSELTIIADSKRSYIYDNNEDLDSYGYVWNICGVVTGASLPLKCTTLNGWKKIHSAYQYKDDNECYVLGRLRNLTFSLIDSTDPIQGVSITYSDGSKCDKDDKKKRNAVVDIYCSNVNASIIRAQERETCSYHMTMESFYACPTDCAITENGLCDSAGTCMYDKDARRAYCQCSDGFEGDDCSEVTESTMLSSPYYIQKQSGKVEFAFGFITCAIFVAAFYLLYLRTKPRRAGYIPIPQQSKDDVVIAEIII